MEGVRVYEDFFFNNINKKTNPEIVMEFYNKWKRYEEALSPSNKLKAQDFSKTLDKFVNRMKDYSKKSQQKSLNKLKKLPEPQVFQNDTDNDTKPSTNNDTDIEEIPLINPPISQNCPPVGTQGRVIPTEGGWIFVYTEYTDYTDYTRYEDDNDNKENKALLIKPTDDKKLEVFSENDVYNKSRNSSCSLFIQYLDDSGEDTSAILVDINEAISYPNINYPEPAVGWDQWAGNVISTGVTYASYIGVIAFLMHVIYTLYIYNDYRTLEALNEFLREQAKQGVNISEYRAFVRTSMDKLVASGRISPKHAPALLDKILTYLKEWTYRNA